MTVSISKRMKTKWGGGGGGGGALGILFELCGTTKEVDLTLVTRPAAMVFPPSLNVILPSSLQS